MHSKEVQTMGSRVEIEPAFGYLHPPPAHDSLAPQSPLLFVSGSFLVCPTRALSSFSSPKHNPQFAVKIGSPLSLLSVFSTLLFGIAKSIQIRNRFALLYINRRSFSHLLSNFT